MKDNYEIILNAEKTKYSKTSNKPIKFVTTSFSLNNAALYIFSACQILMTEMKNDRDHWAIYPLYVLIGVLGFFLFMSTLKPYDSHLQNKFEFLKHQNLPNSNNKTKKEIATSAVGATFKAGVSSTQLFFLTKSITSLETALWITFLTVLQNIYGEFAFLAPSNKTLENLPLMKNKELPASKKALRFFGRHTMASGISINKAANYIQAGLHIIKTLRGSEYEELIPSLYGLMGYLSFLLFVSTWETYNRIIKEKSNLLGDPNYKSEQNKFFGAMGDISAITKGSLSSYQLHQMIEIPFHLKKELVLPGKIISWLATIIFSPGNFLTQIAIMDENKEPSINTELSHERELSGLKML